MSKYRTNLDACPEGAAIVDYLIEHGPSTSCEMKDAGLVVTHGLTYRLHLDGYIKKCKGTRKGHNIWRSNI